MYSYFTDFFGFHGKTIHRIAVPELLTQGGPVIESITNGHDVQEVAANENVTSVDADKDLVKVSDAAATQPTFRLLELPPEMRNRIYYFALCSIRSIKVYGSGYERPGILSANHQLRSECLAIFYLENEFSIRTHGYDSTSQHRFWKSLPRLEKDPHLHKNPSYRSRPHWENLLTWLERHHKGEVGGVSSPERQAKHKHINSDVMVVAGLFSMVAGLRYVTWASVRRLIEAQRPVLVRMDGRWALDGDGWNYR